MADIRNNAGEAFDELRANGISNTNSQLLSTLPTLQRWMATLAPGNVIGNSALAALNGCHTEACARRSRHAGGQPGIRRILRRRQSTASRNARGRYRARKRQRSVIDTLTREEQKKKAIAELDKFRAQYTAQEYANIRSRSTCNSRQTKGARGGIRTSRSPSDASIQNARDR